MEPLQSRELEKTWSDGEQFSQPAENVASDKSEVREEGKSEEGQDTTPLLEKNRFFLKNCSISYRNAKFADTNKKNEIRGEVSSH